MKASTELIELRRLVLEYREARKALKQAKATCIRGDFLEAKDDTKAARKALFAAAKENP